MHFYGAFDGDTLVGVRVCPKFCVNTEMQCKIEPK